MGETLAVKWLLGAPVDSTQARSGGIGKPSTLRLAPLALRAGSTAGTRIQEDQVRFSGRHNFANLISKAPPRSIITFPAIPGCPCFSAF